MGINVMGPVAAGTISIRSDRGRARRGPELASADVQILWSEYRRSGSHQALNGLIEHYAPLVRRVASRLSTHLPQTVEQADLASWGIFGLMDAIEKFDVSRGVEFESYAVVRIRGAMLDALRVIDWVPRSVRSNARSVEQASSKLYAQLRRAPTDAEISADLGIDVDELRRIFESISYVDPIALDQCLSGRGGEPGGTMTLHEAIPDRGERPGDAFDIEETKELLAAAISELNDRERAVLTLYYFENFTMAKIGQQLGVTESRICQIHTKIVCRLRADLRAPLLDAA